MAHKMILTKLLQQKYSKLLPYFHSENLAEFCIRCIMVPAGFHVNVYSHAPLCMVYGTLKCTKIPYMWVHIVHIAIPHVTNWYKWGQSHTLVHHAPTWICAYNISLEHICTFQGQEHLWLRRGYKLTTNVHHSKCMIYLSVTNIYSFRANLFVLYSILGCSKILSCF